MTVSRSSYQQSRSCQNCLLVAECEQSANTPALAPFTGDLNCKFNKRFEDLRIVLGDLAQNTFKHELFLARKNGKIAGRIMASDDPNYNSLHQTNVGCFGLFGASSLPRLYVRLLARLAREREVHVFLLRASPFAVEEHPLAASLGRLSRGVSKRDRAPVRKSHWTDPFSFS